MSVDHEKIKGDVQAYLSGEPPPGTVVNHTCMECGHSWSDENAKPTDCPSCDVNFATAVVLDAISGERKRQERLKSEGRFPHTCADPELNLPQKLAVLAEEFGEVARCVVEASGLANDKHHPDAMKALRKELVEVAAVCCAWAEALS